MQPVKTNCGNTIRLVRVGFYGVTKIELYIYSEKIIENDKLLCSCGKAIGIDKGSFIKMDPKAFVYTGTKRNK